MTAPVHLPEIHTESVSVPRRDMFNTARGHGRFIWFICASLSLLSSRHLLVEQNIHYPLQLYFNQLAVAVLLTSCRHWKLPDDKEIFRERLQFRKTGLVAASLCSMSLSIICAFQAILHLQNLPTLVMMTVRPLPDL